MKPKPTDEQEHPESPAASGVRPEQELAIKADQLGAVYMLPPHEFDSPLTEEEIAPRFGTPVIVNGVNFAAMSQKYLCDVHGKDYANPQSASVNEPTLRDLAARENDAAMEFNFRLLCDHDSKAHKKAGVSSFEKYVAEETGEKHSRSTLIRRMVHIKFALLAAADGGADALPSQNQANTIGRLPRGFWVRFWRHITSGGSGKKIGKAALEEAVVVYAQRNRLPLRGMRLDSFSDTHSGALALPDVRNDSEAPVLHAKGDIKKRLLSVLAIELPQRLPDRVQRRAKKQPLARSYLKALQEFARKCPSVSEAESHRQLLILINENHPDLGRRLLSQAIAKAFKEIADKLK